MARTPLKGMNKKQLNKIIDGDNPVYFDLVEHIPNSKIKVFEDNSQDQENPGIYHNVCAHHFTYLPEEAGLIKSKPVSLGDDLILSLRITDGIIERDNLKGLIETGITEIELFKTKYLREGYWLSFKDPRTITLSHAYILKPASEKSKSKRYGDSDAFWTELALQALDDYPNECRSKTGKPIKSRIALAICNHWSGKYWNYYNQTDYRLGDFEEKLKDGDQAFKEEPPISQRTIIDHIKIADLI